MAYIGKDLNDIATANIAVNTMIGNGSTTTMGISMGSKGVGSVNDVTVFVEGVRQTPGTDYTLSGSTLTFTTAPASGVKVVSMSHGDSWNNAPADGTVTGSKLKDASVTSDKIIGLDAGKLSGSLSGSGTNLTNLNAANLSGTLPAVDGSALTGITSYEKEATDPTATSNKTLGTMWVNKTTGEMYVLTDATTDANVWTNVGGGTGDIFGDSAATGGTVATVGDYKIHTFTSSGNFVVSESLAPFEYLLVAGGGGGGSGQSNSNYAAGGGGAGGMLTGSISISNGTYPIVVGAGGVGQAEDTNKSYSGANSLFSTLIATGGGGGGPRSNNNSGDAGQAGGSGGGAGCGSSNYAHSYVGGLAIANKIPTMTSNTAPWGTAFASQNGNTGDSSACWKAFDNSNSTFWTTTSNGTSFAGVDLGFNFTTGFAATGYTLTLKDADANQAPKDWTFQGSNDGVSWTTLDTEADWNRSQATGDWAGYGAQKITWTFSNTTSYTRYKWVFTGSVQAGQEVFITRAQIFTTGGQGNDGGDGGVDAGGGGGGGGASAVGVDGTANPGAGGAGLASTLSGSSVTYAGGGGGGAGSGSAGGNGGAGGAGGGGAGSSSGSSNAVAATVNTGGGGGGSAKGYQTGAGASASGGSGIVIIKYKFR